MSKSQPHIIIEGLYKSFGNNQVLRGVDLIIERGKTNIILGGSGAGKTVLLRHIIGLLKPDRGRILIDNKDITKMGEVELNTIRKKFGMVFQMSALFDSMTVFDNVAFPLREHTKLSSMEIQRRVLEKLEILGLKGAEKLYPSDLSGGMKKRVGVARALIMEPEILIYDEPTTGLDPHTARNVDNLINEMAKRFKITSIVITHDLTTCFGTGDRISLIHEGKIRISCSPEEFIESEDPIVKSFIEASGVNVRRILNLRNIL